MKINNIALLVIGSLLVGNLVYTYKVNSESVLKKASVELQEIIQEQEQENLIMQNEEDKYDENEKFVFDSAQNTMHMKIKDELGAENEAELKYLLDHKKSKYLRLVDKMHTEEILDTDKYLELLNAVNGIFNIAEEYCTYKNLNELNLYDIGDYVDATKTCDKALIGIAEIETKAKDNLYLLSE